MTEQSKYTRLTKKQWAEIVELYETGDIQPKDIAERYGVSASAISQGLQERGAIYGRIGAEQAQKAASEARDDFTTLITRVRETKDSHYKIAKIISGMAQETVTSAYKGETSWAEADEKVKVLLNAMKIQGQARIERFALLGLDKDNFLENDQLPELRVVEMTQDEIQAIRSSQDPDYVPDSSEDLEFDSP